MKNFTLNLIENKTAELIFDMQKEKVNKLSTQALSELDTFLDEIIESDLETIIIKSAKQGIFIAGADIKEIESMSDELSVKNMLNHGNEIFNKLSTLKQTTIALIEGACMGGGLELALSCDFRVAIDGSKTKLALPEVKLGVMPGLGGTQRLPKLVGLQNALGMILAGSVIDTRKADRIGLVDKVIPKGYEEFQIPEFLQSISTPSGKQKIVEKRKSKNFLEQIPFVRDYMYKKAHESLIQKTKGFYPAPLRALETIKKTWDLSIYDGLKIETEEFSKLALSEVSKNMINLFFISEATKSKKFDAVAKEIQSTAVIGGGVMGKGIIWLFSNAGKSVRVKLRKIEQMGDIIKSVKSIYTFLIKRKKTTSHDVDFKISSITYTDKYDGLQNVDLALEAVLEDEAVKNEVYANLEKNMKKDAIIATNTSSISINQLNNSLTCKENFVGLHFFNPVDRMPLVEIIPSKHTSQETLATVYKFMLSSGKTPVIVDDCAGFLVNRILIPYVNEALFIAGEGVNIETIDKALSNFGMPMGPIELVDTVGIDVGYKVLQILQNAYGQRMTPAPLIEPVYTKLQLLGKKSGSGFYMYKGKEKTINTQVNTYIQNQTLLSEDEIVKRCIYMMINEAARCLEEEIVKSSEELDLAMIMGTGFPPFRGGLLKYADSIGTKKIYEELENLQNSYGSRFEPAPLIKKLAVSNKKFY
ncbi:3-hydroxyacyl-CoA dehydrogenase NAD-binding domain-containing protein [Sulfurospirillum arcachonense]|uniref:3-hydroxyacyl-CoA dehydrogenase NAD-binding domain-containing protein n=1 Tax=Sulfurospirillum arcachonense TaxID=57666 RepID=UPI00046914B7|nr:3-hydroxyacyl-CoA dehydrogenase NAD-binding domain-containing protein [Sulfurospirillum arcachonense]